METLVLVPRGEVTEGHDYGNRTVSFENGVKQNQRIWTKPRKTYSFSTQGDKTMKKYLENFIDARFGNHEPFYWEYDDEVHRVRFADSKLDIVAVRGYGGTGTVGYKVNVSLEELKDSEG